MILLKEQLIQYCIDRNLTPPSKNDIENTGRMMAQHFKKYWTQRFSLGVIADAGFIRIEEDGKPMTVFFYPLAYKESMYTTFDLYYQRKYSPRPERPPIDPPAVKKARQRNPIPAFTGKKLMKQNG